MPTRNTECPECAGTGTVTDERRSCDTRRVTYVCPTCKGMGEVEEEDEE